MSRRVAIERRTDAGPMAAWLAPAIALLLTVLTCMLLFALLGRAPEQVIEVFFFAPLATLRGWGEVGLKAAPLILCGVGLALCFRANVWNIGAEGQLIAGAIAGGGVALLATPGARRLVRDRAACRRRGWHGLGRNRGVAARSLQRQRDPRDADARVRRATAACLCGARAVARCGGLRLPADRDVRIGRAHARGAAGTRLHIGLPLALVVAALAWGLLQRTTVGLQLRVHGVAPRAARYAGFSGRGRCGSRCSPAARWLASPAPPKRPGRSVS